MMKKLDISEKGRLMQMRLKSKKVSKNILNGYNHIFHHNLIGQK